MGKYLGIWHMRHIFGISNEAATQIMIAKYLNEKNRAAYSVKDLPKVEAESISKAEILEKVKSGEFRFYGSAHAAMLNQNYDYRLVEGNCIRVWSPTMGRFFTIALKVV